MQSNFLAVFLVFECDMFLQERDILEQLVAIFKPTADFAFLGLQTCYLDSVEQRLREKEINCDDDLTYVKWKW